MYLQRHYYPINLKVEFKLLHGWNSKDFESYSQYLEEAIQHDFNRGYTVHGPHTADISITSTVNNAKIQNVLSRGQQRLTTLAMYFAQVEFVSKKTE